MWKPPDEITTALAEVDARGLDQLGVIELVTMPVCDAARDAIDRAAVARHRRQASALDAHALLVREKLAATLGAFLGRFGVTDRDWELTAHLMSVSSATRRAVADELRQTEEQRNEARGQAEARRARIVANAEDQAATAQTEHRIMTVARDHDDWIAESKLRKCLSKKQRGYFPEAVECLVKNGDLEARDTVPGHGPPGTEYRPHNGWNQDIGQG